MSMKSWTNKLWFNPNVHNKNLQAIASCNSSSHKDGSWKWPQFLEYMTQENIAVPCALDGHFDL